MEGTKRAARVVYTQKDLKVKKGFTPLCDSARISGRRTGQENWTEMEDLKFFVKVRIPTLAGIAL
jgi:hypothetical protein